MPCLAGSRYCPPWWLPGGHVQTIFPALFRRVRTPSFTRARLSLPDQDFLLLDSLRACRRRSVTVVVLSHGLEGHSGRAYMRGMALACIAVGWDVCARNFRACGGEMNLSPAMYHSGQTDDLHRVVLHCLAGGYRRILLVGFSMGGNQILKYLGEDPAGVPEEVRGAVVFSVPCHLAGAARVLDLPRNALYMRHFLGTLREKVRQKHALYPDLYPLDGLETIRTFAEFDRRYTAPAHGFASAEDYWEKASSLPHLGGIRVPTLLVNAANDPFLSPACFPSALARKNPHLTLEIPPQGGHVGFTPRAGGREYWSETRAVDFFSALPPT